MAFLGLAHTFRSGEMIRVGLLSTGSPAGRAGPSRSFRWCWGSASSASSPGMRSRFTYDSYRFNDMAQGVLPVPLWIPQLGYAAGLVILAIAFLDELVHVAARRRAPLREAAPGHRRRGGRARHPERGLRMGLVEIAGLLLLLLVALLAGGVWIAIALMACGFVGMQFAGGGIPAGSVLATTIWGNAASWTLAALPLFIWMGEILFRTRLSEEMFRGLAPWLNWIPGRLLHVNVLACGLFGSVSGSSAATCATVAKIALPELKKRGYDDSAWPWGRSPAPARSGSSSRPPSPWSCTRWRRTSPSSRSSWPASCRASS